MSYQGHQDQHFGCISYSQQGEDMLIVNLFKQMGITYPSYLDLGAHHPLHISNTALMYFRGSRGVNVEANERQIEAFERERPMDKNVWRAVVPSEGPATLYMFGRDSGRNTCSWAEALRYSSEYGAAMYHQESVPSSTVAEIVKTYCNGSFPNFLNCDLEGSDFDVLHMADFSTSRPDVICVETYVEDARAMVAMLDLKGYDRFCRMGENLIFTHKSHKRRLRK